MTAKIPDGEQILRDLEIATPPRDPPPLPSVTGSLEIRRIDLAQYLSRGRPPGGWDRHASRTQSGAEALYRRLNP